MANPAGNDDDRFYSSDDSSFYGNEETKAACSADVDSFNPLDYWAVHQGNFRCMITQDQWRKTRQVRGESGGERKHKPSESPESARQQGQGIKRIKTEIKSEDDDNSNTPADTVTLSIGRERQGLFNPFEDNPMAYQLEESIDDFLTRLRPSQTTAESEGGGGGGGPWIWIADPRSSRRPASEDIAGFKQAGSRLLEEYMDKKRGLEHAMGDHAAYANANVLRRRLKPDRDQLEGELLCVAKAKNVTAGKWMLFVSAADVDATWRVVAKATLDGRLGFAAKVDAIRSGSGGEDDKKDARARLICIYTDNFANQADVGRVLLEMKNLDLPSPSTPAAGQAIIYYKCDAYTYLDIFSGNEYDLKASMYSSRDFEGGSRSNAGGRRRHRS